ncbi:MAG: GT2 family glycosyltransferase [Acidimicrobiales bacterium]|jgi:GT2 family glycosyltransferase
MHDEMHAAVPTVSIVVPVYQPEVAHLQAAVDSVLTQSSSDWQLLLVADGPQPGPVDEVLDRLDDERVVLHRRAEQGGIVAASNDAIGLATGDVVCFLDNDDVLERGAIDALQQAFADFDDTDLVYTDEDKLDAGGLRVAPFHKPGWSPERLRSQMYLGHLVGYRRSLIEKVGGLRAEFNGAQDHDLALRASEQARRITHIPRVLYHWRMVETSTALDPEAKLWAFEAGVNAVQSHLDRVGIPAVASLSHRWTVTVDPALTDHPLVSIIVLTGGSKRIAGGREILLVENAIASVVGMSSYPNYEILVVLDRGAPDELGHRLVELGQGRVRIVRDTEPFSFSGANNMAVGHADGDLLLFLNDDTEVITPDWLERMVLLLEIDDIGAVGCRLEYHDGTIQHAGVVGRHGGPGHRSMGLHGDDSGSFQSLHMAINTLAATGACLGVSRAKFEAVGGFSLAFPMNFNDVDLCLKLVAQGWRTAVDNRTRLVHFESSTRESTVESWEHLLLLDRWRHLLHNDPWDNRNLHGYGVEDLPPPTALTRLRELTGRTFESRSWPMAVEPA